jgi:hypothetical protein
MGVLFLALPFIFTPSGLSPPPPPSDERDAPSWRGLRVGSRVERGADWDPRYGAQDGGGRGTVVELRPWRGGSPEGGAPNASSSLVAARVRWDATGAVNAYRWGAPGGGPRDLAVVGWRPLSAEEAAVPSSASEVLAAEAARAVASAALGGALRALWAAWGGPGWRSARGWWAAGWPACGGGGREPGAAAPRAAWEGLACAPDHGALLGVDLSGGGLRGPLGGGGALEALPAAGLQSLNLARNALSGGLPEALCGLTQLRFLDLSYNALEGPLPPCLGDLLHLEVLSLAGNAGLTGPVPPRWARLRALRALHLHGCEQLEGPLPRTVAELAAGVRHVSLPGALREHPAAAAAAAARGPAKGGGR